MCVGASTTHDKKTFESHHPGTATRGNALHPTATHCKSSTSNHPSAVTQSNLQQLTATRCNTLQPHHVSRRIPTHTVSLSPSRVCSLSHWDTYVQGGYTRHTHGLPCMCTLGRMDCLACAHSDTCIQGGYTWQVPHIHTQSQAHTHTHIHMCTDSLSLVQPKSNLQTFFGHL